MTPMSTLDPTEVMVNQLDPTEVMVNQLDLSLGHYVGMLKEI